MKTFEELHCWQKAKDLSVRLYEQFTEVDDSLFRELITEPCFAIATHITVGHGKSVKDNTNYLSQARGASAQLRYLLHVAKELNYIDEHVFTDFYNEALDIAKMLSGLIKVMRQKPAELVEAKA